MRIGTGGELDSVHDRLVDVDVADALGLGAKEGATGWRRSRSGPVMAVAARRAVQYSFLFVKKLFLDIELYKKGA